MGSAWPEPLSTEPVAKCGDRSSESKTVVFSPSLNAFFMKDSVGQGIPAINPV